MRSTGISVNGTSCPPIVQSGFAEVELTTELGTNAITPCTSVV
jgi:hypothetical protein